jgi:hypothetical protein
MESAWIDFALETAPRFAVAGFLAGFGFWSAAWLFTRWEGNRFVRLSTSVGTGLIIGVCSAALVGGAIAVFGFPTLFSIPWSTEFRNFLVSLIYTKGLNYWWMLAAFTLVILVSVIGCVWLEAGRDPPPRVGPPFSPLAYQEHVIWSHLIDDRQLTPAFESLHRSTKAFEIFRWFADEGNAAAQNNVGVMFESGWGVEQSDAHAEDYFRRAAERGIGTAQFNLAAVLVGDTLRASRSEHNAEPKGRLVEGYKWALIAKAQHYPGVSLRRFRKRMNRAEIAEGERLAQLWLKQHGMRKQSKLSMVIKEAPRVLRRELWGSPE